MRKKVTKDTVQNNVKASSTQCVSIRPPSYGVSFIDDRSIQRKENKTGMPDQLKSGVESLSGIDMGDVKVHYNSSQPAQLNAHAYAQGNQIHLAPGQEKHLPHEAWHVVQQKQGRVKPTRQMKGKVNVNDDSGLEKEADVMGAKASKKSIDPVITAAPSGGIVNNGSESIIQHKKKWTAKQQAQSENFWKKKHARAQRKENALQAYVDGMKDRHNIVVTKEQARVLSSHGYGQDRVNELNGKIPVADLVKLCMHGFGTWAVEQVEEDKIDLDYLTDWQTPAPAGLVNVILGMSEIPSWIEAHHAAERAEGDRKVAANKNKIATQLGVDISRTSGGAFVLNPADYVSACVFTTIRQTLVFPGDLNSHMIMLARKRKDKCKSEHAIQEGDQIFFKGKPGDSTVVHELVHFYGAQEKFIKNFCFGKADKINEGFTEFFARHAEKASYGRIRDVYPREVAAVKFMADHIGWNVLRLAYFTGDVTNLKRLYKLNIGADWTPEEETRISNGRPTLNN